MLDNLKEDTRRLRIIKRKGFPWYVLESLLFETGYQAVVLHRMAAWCKRHRLPALGPALARLNQFLTGVEIGPGAQIGPGLRIVHGCKELAEKLGRNDLCPCGSGKRFKKCCLKSGRL